MDGSSDLIVDLTDAQLRASHRLKWGIVPDDVLPAWVAEMDFALPQPIAEALHSGIDSGALGYPSPSIPVVSALTGFCSRRYGWDVDPTMVTKVDTVLGALRVVLEHVAEPGPVVLPVPAYPPFLGIPGAAGHELVTLPTDPWGPSGVQMPLDRISEAIEAGARTVILCNPHNPLGRAWRRDELESLRDLTESRGVLVVSDEIHGPLTRPGVTYTPYLSVASPSAPAVALLASTKAFNCPGVPSAQIVWSDPDHVAKVEALGEMALPWSLSLGDLAAEAAYTRCDAWLDALRERVAGNHARLTALLADRLPDAKVLPHEATYLAWVNLRHWGHDDAAAMLLDRGRVKLGGGFGPSSEGCVRVNLATSPERVEEIVDRMVRALA